MSIEVKPKHSFIAIDFIVYLDDLCYLEYSIITQSEKDWVKDNNIALKYKKGASLRLTRNIQSEYKMGDTVYIVGAYEESAKYLISSQPTCKKGTVVNSETLEKNSELININ